MNRKIARIRRATHTRHKLRELNVVRLVVYRTSRHIYAQIISSNNSNVLISASSVEKYFKKEFKDNIDNKSAIVGRIVAERALKQGIKNVSFDRSGFKYHGRIKILADAARASGLNF